MCKEYTSVVDLVVGEKGSTGHVLMSGGHEIGGQDVPISYRLKDVSSPVGGAKRNVIWWFDGDKLNKINNT